MTRPALLLDRDGTLIRDVGRQLWDPAAVELLPGVAEGLGAFRDAGWTLFIVTNQAGIALLRYSEKDFAAVQRRMLELLEAEGIAIAGVRHCPHTGLLCSCRKPKPGMWESLREEFPWLTPQDSLMVGDKDADTGFGKNVGCRTARIPSEKYPFTVPADFTVADLRELAALVL